MKSQNELVRDLREFDLEFDPENYSHCVMRAMLLLKISEARFLAQGYAWPADIDAQWKIERAINHRPSYESMMFAAIGEIENIENEIGRYNAIPLEHEGAVRGLTHGS